MIKNTNNSLFYFYQTFVDEKKYFFKYTVQLLTGCAITNNTIFMGWTQMKPRSSL